MPWWALAPQRRSISSPVAGCTGTGCSADGVSGRNHGSGTCDGGGVSELRGVSGVGEKKLETYGDEIIALIAEFS